MGNKRLIVSVILVIVIITAGLGYAHIEKNNKNKNQKEAEIIVKDEKVKAIDEGIDTSNWDLNKVKIEYDTESVPVPVPIGWTASGAEGEHTVNTGFVIYEGEGEINDENAWTESINRNQFVWVPVKNASNRIYESSGEKNPKKSRLWNFTTTARNVRSQGNGGSKYEPGVLKSGNYDSLRYLKNYLNLQDYSRDTWYKELQVEYDTAMRSIEKYGGFFIGRYETGSINQAVPVVRRMDTNLNSLYQTWYAMYPKMRNISRNENVQTSMIWGCLFDEVLQWLIDTENKTYADITNSTNWGNYNNSSFTYKNINGNEVTKDKGTSTRIPAGSSEYTKVNNIYDLAGNLWDWTLEGNGEDNRYLRGGYYRHNGASVPAQYHYFIPPNNTSDWEGTYRLSCILVH